MTEDLPNKPYATSLIINNDYRFQRACKSYSLSNDVVLGPLGTIETRDVPVRLK